MSITENVNKAIITAMKAKDEAGLRALRAIKSAFLLAGTETGNKDIHDELALKTLQKMAKQRKDSIEIFLKENREDLAKKEKEELEVIETYLPKALSHDEVKAILQEIITETGASGMADIGKIMPVAMQKMAGKSDGKTINLILKELFNS